MTQETPIPEQIQDGINLIQNEDPNDWIDFNDWRIKALLILAAALLVLWLFKKFLKALRRMRPPRLHPKLQKYGANYGEPTPAMLKKRRAEAAKVLATSSTANIAGYELTEQIETVFVDGFRRPEDALEGLKAVAAMKGANAVTNVRHERTANDKLSATGDAVIVRKVLPEPAPTDAPEPAPTDAPQPAPDGVEETPEQYPPPTP